MNLKSRAITSTLQQKLKSVWDFMSRFLQLDYQGPDGPLLIINGPTGQRLAVISVMTLVRLLRDKFSARDGEQQSAHSHTAV